MKKIGFLFVLSFFISCDYVEEPFIENNGNNGSSGEGGITKVLIEDFTGHKCPNCPRAAEELDFLMYDVFPNQIIPVSIHAGSFASTNNSYTVDYTTNVGNELNSFFNIQAYPSGLVNRVDLNSNPIKNYQDWSVEANEILINTPTPPVTITINNSFNSSSRELTCVISTEFQEEAEGTFMLCAWMTEDSLISKQSDNKALEGYVENYVHMHVLRGALNSTWGDTVANGTLNIGYTTNNSYNITVSSEYAESNCKVVAFIYKYDDMIIQAEQKSVVE